MSKPSAVPTRGVDSGPSRLWYLLAIIVFVAGMMGMGIFLSNQLTAFGEDLVQVVVPGEMELALDSGSHTIFHERRSAVDGRIFSADDIAGLGVALTSDAGEPVALAPPAMSGSYEFAGRSGAAAFEFEIADPGVYLLSAAYPEGTAGPATVLAVGMGFGGDLFRILLGAFAFAFTGLGLALAIGVTVFVKRRAARRASHGQIGTPA